MVLPEKLVRVGLGLGSFLPSTASDVGAASHDVLKLRDLGRLVGSSTTDLVRFGSTLKVARAIVEEHRRAEVVEVPTSSLVSILDRIHALEKEVEELLHGKQANKNSKGIESLESGTASSPASPAAAAAAASSSDGGSSSSSSDGGSGSSSSPFNKNSASGSDSSDGSTLTSEFKPASTGGLTTDEDDCAPEHLLYRLGGGSVQRRSVTVSEHPLFRRTTDCTLDSVSGSPEGKTLPSGAAVFKEDSSANASDGASPASGDDDTANKSDTASPATDKSGNTSATPDSQSAAPSANGNAAKQNDASLTLTSPPSATTAANLGGETKGIAAESQEKMTITTIMTSTTYTTLTIERRPSFAKAGLDGKYANTTASISAPASSAGHLFKNSTVVSTATRTSVFPAALLFTGVTNSVSSPSATENSNASVADNSNAGSYGNYYSSTAVAGDDDVPSTTASSGQIFFEVKSTTPQPKEAVVVLPASVVSTSSSSSSSSSSLQTISSLARLDSTPAATTVTSTTTLTTTITIIRARSSSVMKPEVITTTTPSALAADSNGALVKRRSGFQTVRILQRRTADGNDHF